MDRSMVNGNYGVQQRQKLSPAPIEQENDCFAIGYPSVPNESMAEVASIALPPRSGKGLSEVTGDQIFGNKGY